MNSLPYSNDTVLHHLLVFIFLMGFLACREKGNPPLPDAYKQSGTFIKTLPYFNPDSCALLIGRDVPKQWQGAVYENLFLDGPEDSPLELGFRHLDVYERNFPADTAREFAQLWRGRLYTHLGKLDSARACLQESYESALRHQRYIRAGNAQYKIAQIYHKELKTAQALRAFLSMYEAVKNLDSSQNLRKFSCIIDVSNAYIQAGNPREALAWADRAAALVADENTPRFQDAKVNVLARYAFIYIKLNQPDSAILMAKKALELQLAYKTNNNRPDILTNLGDAYLAKKDCQSAVHYFIEARQTMQGNNPSTQLYLASKLAESYTCIGRLDSAEILFKQALQSPAQVTVANAQQGLSDIYTRQGRYKAAFEALQANLKIRNQVFSPEKMQEIANVKSALELERSERRATELEQAKKMAWLQTSLVFLLLLVVVGLSLGLYLRQRSQRRILEQGKWLLEQENQLLIKGQTLLQREKQLAEALAQLKTSELERSEANLETVKTELETTAQLLALKNQLIEEMKMRHTQANLASNDSLEASHKATETGLRRMKILTDEDWSKFQERFEQSFPGFMDRLKEKFPDLTPAEKRLLLLYKLKFEHQEISETLGISVHSVYRSRYRLKNKIGLSASADLDLTIAQFS